MGRVIVLGSINVDLETTVDTYPEPGAKVIGHTLSRYAGGKGANQAVAARAQGADVTMVGAVGDDSAGQAMLGRLFEHGVKLQVERVTQTPTGHAIILSDGQTNSIVVLPGANAKVGPWPLRPIRGMNRDDILLMQMETPVETVAAAARHAHGYGVRIVINQAPFAPDLPQDVVALADPLIIQAADVPALTASGTRPRTLVVLRGKEGLEWDGQLHTGTIVPDEEVVDTVGATDALIGTLVAALSQGKDRAAAARVALQAAADNIRHAGAQPNPRL